MTQHIERLTRLHIDGDPTAHAHLAREQARRGMWWCVADNPPPIRTLEALREWAAVEFFADGLGVYTLKFHGESSLYLARPGTPVNMLATLSISEDGHPLLSPTPSGAELGLSRSMCFHPRDFGEHTAGPGTACAPRNRTTWFLWCIDKRRLSKRRNGEAKGRTPKCYPIPLNPAESSAPQPPHTPSPPP